MATDVAASAVSEASAETPTRTRREQFDWAAANGIKDKELKESHEKMPSYWEYLEAFEKDSELASPKMLTEVLFENKTEYYTYRRAFYSRKLESKIRAFEATQTNLKQKIKEAEDFLSIVGSLGAEVAENRVKASKLKAQYESIMAKLSEAGFVEDEDDELED